MSVARGQMVCLHIRVGPGRAFHFRHRSGVVNHHAPHRRPTVAFYVARVRPPVVVRIVRQPALVEEPEKRSRLLM